MHPLDRVRRVASYALAFLLVLHAAFSFAMLTLGLWNVMQGEPWRAANLVLFLALTLVFAGAAWFFAWFGRMAGR